MKKYIFSTILLVLVISGLLDIAQSSVLNNESVNGQGTLVNEDGSRSQFSFNAQRNPNGNVTGHAILRNPSFKTKNGQHEQIKIDVTCLKIVGNVAVLGGMTNRKNN
jgi:hypothetical protein